MRAGSPADQDGLKIGDALYRFGTVTHELRNDALQKVVETVKQNLDNLVIVSVLRKNLLAGTVEDIEINYTPREWQG